MKLLALSPFLSTSAAGLLPWLPMNGSVHGMVIDRLMSWNLLAVGGLFVVAHLLLVLAVVRRRRQRKLPHFVMAESVPLVLLCGLYAWMAITAERLWAADRFEGPSLTAMQVEVTGVQFQWYFRYPGSDAAFGTTRPELVSAGAGNPLGLDGGDDAGRDDVVSSELVLPAGREVDLRLRAQDVIHGFFVPGMRLKQNAVPGLLLHVHFTPSDLGEYAVLCSQVCGLGHGHMQAKLRVVSPDEFERWLAARERRRLAEDGTRR